MRRAMMAVALVMFVLAMTGCGKKYQKENVVLKSQIDSLNTANQKLSQDNQSCQTTLKSKEDELQKKLAEVQAQSQQENAAFQEMQAAMKAELDAKQVTIQELEGKMTLSMVEAILFDSGKAVVKKQGQEALKKVADVLKGVKDQEIIVAGHTDNVPITSKLAATYPTNWELSAARAIAVVKLLQKDGVDPMMLVATGFGEYRPVADNSTPEGRAQNRRMEIVLMPRKLK
jgi:chemotaxis protein MotB